MIGIKRILAAGGVLLCLGQGLAFAEQRPKSLPADSRIKTFVYNENTVYRLGLHTNFISTVQFAKNEKVQSIQVGDSASWQIVRLKRGDVISIKPLNSDAVTNMTVYTDRRVYTFELRAYRGNPRKTGGNNFRTTFTYPTPVVKQYSDATSYSARNTAYKISGETDFEPVQVYDDGVKTYFVFEENANRPVVFRVGEKNREYIVNNTTSGNTTIVYGVSDQWSVRLGDEAVCIRRF